MPRRQRRLQFSRALGGRAEAGRRRGGSRRRVAPPARRSHRCEAPLHPHSHSAAKTCSSPNRSRRSLTRTECVRAFGVCTDTRDDDSPPSTGSGGEGSSQRDLSLTVISVLPALRGEARRGQLHVARARPVVSIRFHDSLEVNVAEAGRLRSPARTRGPAAPQGSGGRARGAPVEPAPVCWGCQACLGFGVSVRRHGSVRLHCSVSATSRRFKGICRTRAKAAGP